MSGDEKRVLIVGCDEQAVEGVDYETIAATFSFNPNDSEKRWFDYGITERRTRQVRRWISPSRHRGDYRLGIVFGNDRYEFDGKTSRKFTRILPILIKNYLESIGERPEIIDIHIDGNVSHDTQSRLEMSLESIGVEEIAIESHPKTRIPQLSPSGNIPIPKKIRKNLEGQQRRLGEECETDLKKEYAKEHGLGRLEKVSVYFHERVISRSGKSVLYPAVVDVADYLARKTYEEISKWDQEAYSILASPRLVYFTGDDKVGNKMTPEQRMEFLRSLRR